MAATETETEVEDDVDLEGQDGGDAGGRAADADDDAGSAGSETPPPPPSWRDQAKEFGLDLSSHKDDAEAFKFLAERHKQAETAEAARREAAQYRDLAALGNEYQNYAGEFRNWMQERAQAQQKQQQDDPWAPPEYSDAWLTKVRRDDGGAYVPDPAAGGTPEIVQKLINHYDWRNRFMANPREALQGWVQEQAREVAASILDERLPQIQGQFAASQFITNNRDWLYAKDAGGAFTGELSEEGKTFQGYLAHARRMGLNDQQQEEFATHSLGLWRTAKRSSSGSTSGGSAAAKKDPKDEFLKKAAGHGAQSGGTTTAPRGQARGSAGDQNANLSLEEMLRADLKAAGVSDDDFANE